MAGGCTQKKKTTEKLLFFFYLAFVEVVDDLLVEPLLQLPLGRRLVPIPLGEVGRAHVLRPLRQKQIVSGAWGGGARPLWPFPPLDSESTGSPEFSAAFQAWFRGLLELLSSGFQAWSCGQNLCAEASRWENPRGRQSWSRFTQKTNPAGSGTVSLLMKPGNLPGEWGTGWLVVASSGASPGAGPVPVLLSVLINSRRHVDPTRVRAQLVFVDVTEDLTVPRKDAQRS